MKPILFQIGPFPISSFGLFLLLAFVVSIALARRRAAPLGIDPSQMLDIALYMIIGGIVVGRLGYVVPTCPLLRKNQFGSSPSGRIRASCFTVQWSAGGRGPGCTRAAGRF